MGSDVNYYGKAKSMRCAFRYFLKVATEIAEWTDSGRLFQRDSRPLLRSSRWLPVRFRILFKINLLIYKTLIHFCMVFADIDITRLQRIHNQLARLVTKSPPFTRSIPLLRSLHWLPVRFRIFVKINLLTYETLREKSQFVFIPRLPHHFLPVHWDQTMIIVCQSLG